MKKEDFADLPLSDKQIEDALIVASVVIESPKDVDRVIRASGMEPSGDLEEKIYQFIEASIVPVEGFDFDSALDEYLGGDDEEFLAGAGAAIAKAARATAGLFKKRSEAEGGRRFFGRLVDKVKGKIQDRRDRKAAEAAAEEARRGTRRTMEEEEETTVYTDSEGQTRDAKTGEPVKSKEELDKARNMWRIIAIIAIIALIIALGVLLLKKKK